MNDSQAGAQTKSNRGYKLRRPGRARKVVTEADFVDEPNEVMLKLAHIKNNECLSWRQLAEEYLPDYSHAYVRKVTLGEAKSEAIEIALGIKPEPPETEPVPVCETCGHVHTQHKQCSDERSDTKRTKANGWHRRAVWIHEEDMPLFDALLARHGVRNLQELIDNHMIYRRRLDDD